jgi:cilia- and flagella-associated protein 251
LWTTEQLLDDTSMPRGDETTAGPAVTDVVMMATNEFKIKVHATDTTRQCLKTVLGPTFGGPLCNIQVVPAQASSGSRTRVLVFSCHERVVGMIQLPLEGNPREAIALVAHPGEVASMCVSHDGKYLFTAGGRDCAVHQWRLQPEAAVVPGGGKLSHFIDVIEGGPTGAFMKEIIDYFFYAQIRAQGEETTAKRRIENTIPFGQVPSLMRALGFYLSNKDIDNMTFEVKTRFGSPNVAVPDIQIDFEAFIRLYVNHRPVFGITKRNIEDAFAAIGADPVTGIVDRQQLFNILQERGEAIHPYDIDMCLKGLLGDDVTLDMLEDKITAKAFAENLLGFEDYEDEGGMGGPSANNNKNNNAGSSSGEAVG